MTAWSDQSLRWWFVALAVVVILAVLGLQDRYRSSGSDDVQSSVPAESAVSRFEPRRENSNRPARLLLDEESPNDGSTYRDSPASAPSSVPADKTPDRTILAIIVGEDLTPTEAPFRVSITTIAHPRPSSSVAVDARPNGGTLEVDLPKISLDEGDVTLNVWIDHPTFSRAHGLFSLQRSASYLRGDTRVFTVDLPVHRCATLIGRIQVAPHLAPIADDCGSVHVRSLQSDNDRPSAGRFLPRQYSRPDGTFEVKLEDLHGEVFVVATVRPLPPVMWRGRVLPGVVTDIGTLNFDADGSHRISGVMTVGGRPLGHASVLISREKSERRGALLDASDFSLGSEIDSDWGRHRASHAVHGVSTTSEGRFESLFVEPGTYRVSLIATAKGDMDGPWQSPSGIDRTGYFMHPAVRQVSECVVVVPSKEIELALPISRLDFRLGTDAASRGETTIVVSAPDGSVFERSLTPFDFSNDHDLDRGLWVPADTDLQIRFVRVDGEMLRPKVRSAPVGEVLVVPLPSELAKSDNESFDIIVRTTGPYANSISRIEAILEWSTDESTTTPRGWRTESERRRLSANVETGRPGVFKLHVPSRRPGKYRLGLRFDGWRNRFGLYGQRPREDGVNFAPEVATMDVKESGDVEVAIEPRATGWLKIRASDGDGHTVFPAVSAIDAHGRRLEADDMFHWLSPAIDDTAPPTGPDIVASTDHLDERSLPIGRHTAELTLVGFRKQSVTVVIEVGKTTTLDIVMERD